MAKYGSSSLGTRCQLSTLRLLNGLQNGLKERKSRRMKEEEEEEAAAKVARNGRKESAMNGRVIVDVKSGVMP